MTLIDFKQPSTWRGLLSLLGLIGWTLTPELRDQIAIVIVGNQSLYKEFYKSGSKISVIGHTIFYEMCQMLNVF